VKQALAPEKVSPAVLYMVSDLSKDKTGKFLFVSGSKVTELKVVGAEGFKNPNGVTGAGHRRERGQGVPARSRSSI